MIGILLAAGQGLRFDPQRRQNKLLQVLPNGQTVAEASARALCAALPRVLAVVRDPQGPLADCLQRAGCELVACPNAVLGMGASLVCGIRASRYAHGWLVALADMPFVQGATLRALQQAIERGADIAAPFCQGRRGNPVAFGAAHRDRLLQVQGDAGARALLRHWAVEHVMVADPGIFRDIDTPRDLLRGNP
ncbi:NTP transferase domain-containing protein [Castellaniella sp.]|uniref:nucleotidyltransferase family protein n=1 Tax=Castellaniella sp. TaxID=1955812 RepID=UPI00355E5D54